MARDERVRGCLGRRQPCVAEPCAQRGGDGPLSARRLAARLDLSARLLAKHRGVLAALAAVKGVGG